MAFELFFGIFGLISSDSKLRHKSYLNDEWHLSNPFGTNLFREGTLKSSLSSSASGSPNNSFKPSAPIFSTTGPLINNTNNNNNNNSNSNNKTSDQYDKADGVLSSTSVSSASSVVSSGSTNFTTNSTSAFIKSDSTKLAKKYELGSFSSPASSNLAKDAQLDGGLAAKLAACMRLTDPVNGQQAPLSDTNNNTGTAQTTGWKTKRLRSIYCALVCLMLWTQVIRLLVGLLTERSPITLDFYCLGTYRIHFLIPALCLAIQAAAVSLIFMQNNDETNWLVPFYSSKDYLIRSRSNFKPKMESYTRRINVSVVMALILALISSVSLSLYLYHCVTESDLMRYTIEDTSTFGLQVGGTALSPINTTTTTTTATTTTTSTSTGNQIGASKFEQSVLMGLLVCDILWAVYSTYICFIVSFYFNLICSIMNSRFHGISKVIEDLAESNTTKTTNQARKITTLYLEHNEACELLDESNDFWQYLIFFTYFTYIPAYCYCLYNLFFVDFEAWPNFITWVIHTHTGFIILLISFSAAGVSTEIATFLHRVRGLTIGYSCYDLFAITNASMSNTAAACASYFLIVADFSRSSVFTLTQMNGTNAAAAASAATPTTPAS